MGARAIVCGVPFRLSQHYRGIKKNEHSHFLQSYENCITEFLSTISVEPAPNEDDM